jgi:hypothetical protein
MKRIIFAIAILALASGNAFSADKMTLKQKIEMAINGYEKAIQSDNPGLNQSGVFQIAHLYSKYPDADLGKAKSILKKAVRKNDNEWVRLHARMTLEYIANSELQSVKVTDPEDPMVFYSSLYTRMGENFYGITGQETSNLAE